MGLSECVYAAPQEDAPHVPRVTLVELYYVKQYILGGKSNSQMRRAVMHQGAGLSGLRAGQ